MRDPTETQRAKERALAYAAIASVGTLTVLIVAAIVTGSLTMLGGAVRNIFTTSVQFYALWVLFAVHRDRLTRFEYGVGKIEQLVWLVTGLCLVISGLWVAQTVVVTVFSDQPAASPLDLALASIANAVNALVNTLSWLAMKSASRKDDSPVYEAQLSARFTWMVSSLFLQVTLTLAALARDSAIALGLDAIGAVFVICNMVSSGVSIVARGLPHLLDAPASAELSALIRSTVMGLVPEKKIVSIRTRRSGLTTFAEVEVTPTAFKSIKALRDAGEKVRQALRDDGGDGTVDISLVVTAGPPAGHARQRP